MKKIFLLVLVAMAMASCTDIVDYDEGYTPAELIENTGAPEITAVYDIADTEMAHPLSEGEMGQMLHLVGHNLNYLVSLSFNTVEADLSETYTYGEAANVVVPSRLSVAHDNTICYTTKQGTCSFPFVIPFPALTVSGAECEFVEAGSTMRLLGKNFDLYGFGQQAHALLGGEELAIVSTTSTDMVVAIPEGTPDNSTVVLEWENQRGEAQRAEVPFRPTQNRLYGDMNDVSLSKEGSVMVSKDEGYLHVKGSLSGWSWNTIDLSRNMIDLGEMGNLADWQVKFEIMTAEQYPLSEVCPIKWSFNWAKDYSWEPGALNTLGQWHTVTLPLADMAGNGIPSAGTWMTLRLIVQPTTDYDADFSIANIRFERR